MLPNCLVDSKEFGDLPPTAVLLLIHLVRGFNGRNNGNIYAPQQWIREVCGFGSNDTAINSLRALVECGFVVITQPGAVGRARRVGLRWLAPCIERDYWIDQSNWQPWQSGLRFDWRPMPVRKRKRVPA